MTTTETKSEWWNAYRGAASITFEGKVWLTACQCPHWSECECREIARLAFDNNWPIWHALWVYSGQKGKCYCASCERNR